MALPNIVHFEKHFCFYMRSVMRVPCGILCTSTHAVKCFPSLRGVCVCSFPQVDKVCGLTTQEPTSVQPTSPEVTTSAMTFSSPLPSASPSKPLPEQWLGQLAHLRR